MVGNEKVSIPGAGVIAETLKGTFETIKDTFDMPPLGKVVNSKITKNCISCGAPISGPKDETVTCKYCNTSQAL